MAPPPRVPPPRVLPLLRLPTVTAADYRVDSGVKSLNGGHITPIPIPLPSLYFSMGYVMAPQTKEQAESSMNPPSGACNGLAGSLSALIWGVWQRSWGRDCLILSARGLSVLDKNCTSGSYVQFPPSLTTPVSWALFKVQFLWHNIELLTFGQFIHFLT